MTEVRQSTIAEIIGMSEVGRSTIAEEDDSTEDEDCSLRYSNVVLRLLVVCDFRPTFFLRDCCAGTAQSGKGAV